jgi:hypothetical protein
MPFLGSSFNLWNDAALTDEFSGTSILVHQTDLSDNPQDIVLYLGSVLTNRQLQTASSPGVSSITLTPTDILSRWAVATSYVVGDKVQPSTSNGFVYRCTVAGTSHASVEPTWPVSPIGSTVTDGTCTWELYSAHHATTEIKLALSSGGLDTATGGAALSIATTVLGGASNSIPIYIRITNAVTSVANNTGNEEIALNINSCVESGTD